MSSSDHRIARRFVVTTLASVAAMLAVITGAGALTDPTGLLAAGGWPTGLCAPGVKVMDDRILKPMMIPVHRPEEIILGSSRVAEGFTAGGLGPEDGRILNLGMTGAGLTDIAAMARRALDHGSVRRIWIGLDFGAFAMAETVAVDMTPSALRLGRSGSALVFGLLSPQAFQATLGLIRRPSACRSPPFDSQGFAVTPHAGAPNRRVVLPSAAVEASLIRSWSLPPAQREALYAARLVRMEQLLNDLNRRGVAVVLYRSPSHPAYDALVNTAGLTPFYRRWQADTDRLAARSGAVMVAADAPGFLAGVPIGDCPGPRVDCAFRDAVHFRPTVGAAILREGRIVSPQPQPQGSSSMSQYR